MVNWSAVSCVFRAGLQSVACSRLRAVGCVQSVACSPLGCRRLVSSRLVCMPFAGNCLVCIPLVSSRRCGVGWRADVWREVKSDQIKSD